PLPLTRQRPQKVQFIKDICLLWLPMTVIQCEIRSIETASALPSVNLIHGFFERGTPIARQRGGVTSVRIAAKAPQAIFEGLQRLERRSASGAVQYMQLRIPACRSR